MKKHIILLILIALLLNGCTQATNDMPRSAEQIAAMEDTEMYDTLITRFMDTEPNALNLQQLTVAALVTFDAEMMNGGLCQFFANDYSGYAPYIIDALDEIGAIQIQAHYSSFIAENKIDVTQMEDFRIASVQDYINQYERFPYEAFDNRFYELYQQENLYERLLAYARNHADSIFD